MALPERANEVRVVDEALDAAASGRGTLLIVTGPMGIGRTALLHDLAQRAEDREVTVVRASGTPAEQDFSHGIVTQLFDALTRSAGPDRRARWFTGPAADTERLFHEGPPGAAVATRPHFLVGLRSLTAAISRERPLLLLIDDLHLADDSSLAWLGYMARRLDGVRITVVVTVTDGHPESGRLPVLDVIAAGSRRLSLGPLSPEGVAKAVREIFGEDGDPEFVRACHEVSGGTPLLLVPVLLQLLEQGARPVAGEAADLPRQRPPLLRDRLLQQALWQPEPVRDCGSAVAVLGEAAHHDLVTSLTGLDMISAYEALDALERQGLVRPGPTPRFVHPLVREAFEEVLTDEPRDTLHARAAHLLLTHGHGPEEVAGHLLLTTAPVHGLLRTTLRTAAEAALGRGAPETAARYLRRALANTEETAGHRAERAILLNELAYVESRFAPNSADRHFRQALALVDDPCERSAMLLRFPSLLTFTAVPALPELVRSLVTGMECFDVPEHSGEQVLGAWLEALARSKAGGAAHAVACLARLGQLSGFGEAGPSGTAFPVERVPLTTWAEHDLASVLLRSVTVAGLLPRQEVLALAHRILAHESVTSPRFQASTPLLADVLIMADDADALLPGLDRALRSADRQGDRVTKAIVLGLKSSAAFSHGALDTTRRLADASLASVVGVHRTSLPALAALTLLALETGDTALAARLGGETPLARARAEAAGGQVHEQLMLDDMLRGMTRARAADPSGALALFLHSGRRLEEQGHHVHGLLISWRVRAARQHVRLDEKAAAVDLVEEELEHCRTWGAPWFLGRALRARARLAEGVEALALAEDSVRVLETSNNRLELARSSLLLARLLRGAGDRTRAVNQLRRAHDLAVGCGATLLVSEAVTALDALRAEGASRPLTKAQQTVVDHVAQGLSNREIAHELGITPRGVEKHLTAAYRKFGVSTRADLLSVLMEAGLPYHSSSGSRSGRTGPNH